MELISEEMQNCRNYLFLLRIVQYENLTQYS